MEVECVETEIDGLRLCLSRHLGDESALCGFDRRWCYTLYQDPEVRRLLTGCSAGVSLSQRTDWILERLRFWSGVGGAPRKTRGGGTAEHLFGAMGHHPTNSVVGGFDEGSLWTVSARLGSVNLFRGNCWRQIDAPARQPSCLVNGCRIHGFPLLKGDRVLIRARPGGLEGAHAVPGDILVEVIDSPHDSVSTAEREPIELDLHESVQTASGRWARARPQRVEKGSWPFAWRATLGSHKSCKQKGIWCSEIGSLTTLRTDPVRLAFSPSERFLVCLRRHEIRVFDVATLQPVLQRIDDVSPITRCLKEHSATSLYYGTSEKDRLFRVCMSTGRTASPPP